MKRLILKICCFIFLISGDTAFGQASATSNAAATIITPLTISKMDDLNFGNLAVQSASGGTVLLDASGNRSITGGVSLPTASPGAITPAIFQVFGQGGYSFAVTLPSTVLIDNGAGETMLVDDFTSSPTATGTLDAGGTANIAVGARLNVNAAQAAGIYVSTIPFDVTVNYN